MRHFNQIVILSIALFLSSCDEAVELTYCDPTPNPNESPAPEKLEVALLSPLVLTAVVEYTITNNGEVIDIVLVETRSNQDRQDLEERFGRNVIAAVQDWKYSRLETSCLVRQEFRF